jgi:hypothetical protein
MPQKSRRQFTRVLEPMDRVSEILFGLIMVLTITCSFRISGAGRDEVRAMLVSALGCNLAWGIVDGVFYLLGSLSERGHNVSIWRAVRESNDPLEGRRLIADAFPPVLVYLLPSSDLELLRQKLKDRPPPAGPRLRKEDWLGAIGVFLLVFASTFPVALPFVLTSRPARALLVSNLVAIATLFIAGVAFGRYAGLRPWRIGILMVGLGAGLVGLTIAFGA